MNVLTAIAKSFAPPAAYEEAAFEWKWKAIAYILTLSAICAAATSAMSAKPLSDFYEKFILPAIPLMESVEISRGGVKTPDGKPVEFKSASGKTFAVATPGKLDAAAVKGLAFSVERDRLSFYGSGFEQSIPLESFLPPGESAKLSDLFPPKGVMLWAVLPAVFFAASLFMNAVYSLAMGLAAKTLALGAMPSLGYWKCVKIAMLAVTPPTLIDLLLMALVGVPMPGLVFAAIAGTLVWISIRAAAKKRASGTAA